MEKRKMLGYESRHQPLLSRSAFAWRLVISFAASSLLIVAAGLLLSPVVHRILHRFHLE